MTGSLGELLRRGADSVAVPPLDLDGLLAEAGRRRRRRRHIAVASAAAAVAAVVAGSALVVGTSSRNEAPRPAGPPSPSPSLIEDSQGPRPLVYAEGRTIHVGDNRIAVDKPVAFIAPTDEGAVYEATLDGTLWFTDGSTTDVIGTSGFTAAPTSHSGVVVTGSSGSLVVWAVAVRQDRIPVELVVFDTSRGKEVARIPLPERGRASYIAYVGDAEVWYGAAGGTDRHIYRFDVNSGVSTPLHGADLDTVLDASPRVFKAVTDDGRVVHGTPSFTLVRHRLVPRIHYSVTDDDAVPATLSDGSQLRLRLPTGYVGPWPADGEPDLRIAQWLDDDHVVLWAGDGGGDLPASRGDLLVCPLPNGVCRVTVPRDSHPYVAP